jgi:uncharacterized RDD family membrane protein YckC
MSNYDLSGLPDPDIDAQFYTGVPFKRLIAWFIDLIAIVLLTLAVSMATLGIAAIFFPVTLFVLNLAYRVYFLKTKSATPGMSLAGIEIRNHLGNRLSTEEAFWHTVIYTISVMFVFIQILSMGMMLTTRYGQGVHDYLRGTTAINRPVDH